MSSDITISDQCIWVSNSQLLRLVEFGLSVGREIASTANELKWVDKFADWQGRAWPGISFDLGKTFPTLDEKKFWAACYANVARRIFLRELGDQDATCWQSQTIGDAHLVSRLLTRAVQETEVGWHPETEDSNEYSRLGNIRL